MGLHRFGWIAAALSIAFAGAADAGLYRCQRADGSVVYTDSQATCPGAQEHRSTGAVQSVGTSVIHSVPARTRAWQPSASAATDVDAEEAAWRSKKEQTSHELAVVANRHDSLKRFESHCNRGGELFRTLPNGLKEGVSCDDLRSQITSLESRRTDLQAYLDRGIHEACRKAGCLPGWIR